MIISLLLLLFVYKFTLLLLRSQIIILEDQFFCWHQLTFLFLFFLLFNILNQRTDSGFLLFSSGSFRRKKGRDLTVHTHEPAQTHTNTHRHSREALRDQWGSDLSCFGGEQRAAGGRFLASSIVSLRAPGRPWETLSRPGCCWPDSVLWEREATRWRLH